MKAARAAPTHMKLGDRSFSAVGPRLDKYANSMT